MLAGIIIFILLIVVHEYGHFIAAKRNGVDVEEFGIGFPPKLFGKTLGKGIWRAYYTINLLPLGGFVRMKGESESDKRKGSYGAAKIGAKSRIILAGVAMNAIIAILILTVQAGTGMPRLLENQFEMESFVTSRNERLAIPYVTEGGPAEEAGMRTGDIIVAINGQEFTKNDQLLDELEDKAGKVIGLVYLQGGERIEDTIQLNESDDEEGILGIGIPVELVETRHNPLVTPIVAVGTAAQFTWATLQAFGSSILNLFLGNFSEASENVVGPVGIFSLLSSFSAIGFDYVVFFAAIISLTLAIINVLPLPALDGGRLAMALLINSKRVNISRSREELIHVLGFIALLILALVITLVDIGRF
jgi:regulator of sigma E protease